MHISQEVIFPEDDRWTTAAPKQVLPRPVFDWPKVPSVCEDISIGPPALTITQASAPRVPVARLTFVGTSVQVWASYRGIWPPGWLAPIFSYRLDGIWSQDFMPSPGGWDNTVTGERNICDRSIATGPGLANTSHTLEIYVDLVREQVTGLYIYNATVDIPKYPDPLPQAPQLPVISSFPAAPSSGDDTPNPPDSHIPATTRVLPPRPDTSTSDLPTPTTDGDTSSAIIRQSATAGVARGDGISYQDVPLIDIHSPLPSEEQDIAVDFMSAELGLGFSTDTVGPSLRYVPYRDEVEDDESLPPMYSD
ncbi:hypothetical protein EXIGLDRAFT_781860 [Exidia glandulosa HHB12029]|uniref:Uncharacterized protein n=1 Tax=Exidia glandulosa HHB12029 TaxID=1314781 RepID=A0A165B494_EXIGL|nr:hypothetical protein EXIGLDRAFT_781860 [Exidia glandulosa HHB12029]